MRANCNVTPVESKAGAYASIDRTWHAGDVIEINVPMKPTATRCGITESR